MKGKNIKLKWLLFATIGLLLMGFGLSLFGDAVATKMQKADFLEWFVYGTVSLSVFFAGLSVFGQAVVYKVLIEISKSRNNNS
ncbi:hypothetical protein [Mongoliibacter ruber]|uniref:Uncharacterized protein n=1 Tax=Mongoliibacter ruber TaxID=1750599 RepID=A0A2T0WUK5_9BACT|nr:hypothetical protein [Mongoliibacter ruber]PRY90382.1 hypothetical protein CLW00_10141 [Mongoliibacter ruber]